MDHMRINDQGCIVSTATSTEIPPMYGKGGMKRFFELSRSIAAPVPVTSSSVSNITFSDETYSNLGSSRSVLLTTLDFDKGTRIDEIIDADVYEKRKRTNFDQGRNVRPQTDDMANSGQPQPSSQPTSSPNPTATYQPPSVPDAVPGVAKAPEPKKFRLGSELSQTISISQIGEKIMDTPMQLSVREALAASSELSNYLHKQTRKRRVPIETNTTNISNTSITSNASTINSDVNSIRTLYACPSGHAKASLNRTTMVDALLDDGSELNLCLDAFSRLRVFLLTLILIGGLMDTIQRQGLDCKSWRKEVVVSSEFAMMFLWTLAVLKSNSIFSLLNT